MTALITFDVEEYFQVENFKSTISQSDWHTLESRLDVGMSVILDILDRYDAKATFFVLGCVAERCPESITQVHDRGHEIGSHGYSHELVYKQTEQEYRDDIARSLDVLESLIGEKVISYRAPCFSISDESPWAYEVLAECGIRIDSSMFPVKHDRYGSTSGKRFPHELCVHEKIIHEFPISTTTFFSKTIPFAGGGYVRMLPTGIITRCADKLIADGHPLVMYFHPWEFDVKQPRVNAGRVAQFRHYNNLSSTARKLETCIKKYSSITMREYGEYMLNNAEDRI